MWDRGWISEEFSGRGGHRSKRIHSETEIEFKKRRKEEKSNCLSKFNQAARIYFSCFSVYVLYNKILYARLYYYPFSYNSLYYNLSWAFEVLELIHAWPHTCKISNNLLQPKNRHLSISIKGTLCYLTRQIEENLKLDINTIIGFTIKFYGQFVG